MNIFQRQFSTGDVLRAANIGNASLQTWIRRGVIVGHRNNGVDMPGSPGVRRSFSFFNVIEISVARALLDLGMELAHAFQAASLFAHSENGLDGRQMSCPFNSESMTLLCAYRDRSCEIEWKPGTDPIALIRHHLGMPPGFVALEVNPIFDRAVAALGEHPQAIMDFAYGDIRGGE